MPLTTLDRPAPLSPAPSPQGAPGALRRRLGHPSVFLFVILAAQLMMVLDSTGDL